MYGAGLRTGDALPPASDYGGALKRAFLNDEGAGRPLRSPIPQAVVDRARAHRLGRLRAGIAAADCAAILLYSPVNIRYAFDYTNMQVWTAREPMRYALVFADGPAVMFEFKGCRHLAALGAGIDDLRTATAWLYMVTGERTEVQAGRWADEIAALVREHGGGNRRLAIDKVEPLGLRALEARGLAYVEGGAITEHARAIKSADEVALMRWTIQVAERGIARMRAASVPGATENEIWAELHHENIRSGGEWFEARLLTSGPRTNPWYQEASDRVVREGEMIAFDTDMVGPYGYCADLSRSWTCGGAPMTPVQRATYARALEQLEHNTALLAPGLPFEAFVARSWRIPEENRPHRYSLAVHGVGLVDEWPVVPLHVDHASGYGSLEGAFAPGMVVCVESLMASEGTESVKLENQVLITEDGIERLDAYPWEAA